MKFAKEIFEEVGVSPQRVMKDLVGLETTGVWPDGIPVWAAKLCQAWHCSPASGAVTSNAWKFVAESLHAGIVDKTKKFQNKAKTLGGPEEYDLGCRDSYDNCADELEELIKE